jgi:hypothetical protein
MKKITESNRENIERLYINHLMSHITFDELYVLARKGLEKELENCSNEELENRIKRLYPWLLES